tara:strand:+ start:130 stop:396 length:267 start_codon:yes stop_codon:yes gene_type:complete
MEYHIINKVQLFNGSLIRTVIGYVASHEDALALEGWQQWEDWASENVDALEDGSMTLSDHFDIHPICYEAPTITDSIDGMGINLITEL